MPPPALDDPPPPPPPPRRAGASGPAVGARVAGLFALADAGVAWVRQEEALSLGQALGSVAAVVAVYALLGALGGGLLGLVLRRRGVLAATLGLGLFLELYWWTRSHVFWGLPATSPERLGASAVMAAVAFGAAWLLARCLEGALAGGGRAARALLLGVVTVGLAGAGFLVLDEAAKRDSEIGRHNERNADLPNVLLIVVDALRDDVIGAYGSERVKTPVIDGLAERGVLFENTFVQAPFTWASFGSILTGKYPRRHGMLKLGPEYALVRDINVTLPLYLKTARGEDGRQMRDEDYLGAAFMTGAVTRRSGLLHGFDVYCEAMLGHDLVHRSSAWSRFSSEVLLYLLWNKATQRIDYDMAAETAVEWFRNEPDRRFFAFLHLYSTHTPYDPEPRFREMYVDPAYDGPVRAFYAEHRYGIESGQYVPTEADKRQIANLYYGGTTQADATIGEVLDVLAEQGILDDTLVIVTSDHGEELGEHDVWEHNWMWQTNLRVPLVMSWPKGLPEGVRVPAMVEMIDLLPTISDLFDLEPPGPPAEGGPNAEYLRLDGVSLLPLVHGEVDSVREFAFAESGSTLAVQDATTKLVVSRECLEYDPDDPRWESARREPQLFDLAADPGETENLFAARPDDVARLLTALREWDATLPIPREAVRSSHRDDEADHLSALGYSGGIGYEDEDHEPR